MEIEVGYQPGALQGGDEGGRLQEPELVRLPAAQALGPRQPPRAHVDLRLQVHQELVAREGVAHALHDLHLAAELGPERLGVIGHPALLDARLEHERGIAHHGRDAHVRVIGDVCAVVARKRSCEVKVLGLAQIGVHLLAKTLQGRGVVLHEQREVVGVGPGAQAVARGAVYAVQAHDELVARRAAERVVDEPKVNDVGVDHQVRGRRGPGDGLRRLPVETLQVAAPGQGVDQERLAEPSHAVALAQHEERRGE